MERDGWLSVAKFSHFSPADQVGGRSSCHAHCLHASTTECGYAKLERDATAKGERFADSVDERDHSQFRLRVAGDAASGFITNSGV